MTTTEAKWRGYVEKLHREKCPETARRRMKNPTDKEKQAAAVQPQALLSS